jgi:hypothetical protein
MKYITYSDCALFYVASDETTKVYSKAVGRDSFVNEANILISGNISKGYLIARSKRGILLSSDSYFLSLHLPTLRRLHVLLICSQKF